MRVAQQLHELCRGLLGAQTPRGLLETRHGTDQQDAEHDAHEHQLKQCKATKQPRMSYW
jgi:hypothetical protein